MNAEWHRAHVMPKNATEEQRITWHLGHQKHCSCREMPPRLAAMIRARRRGRIADDDVKKHLSGGDRRSIAGAAKALAIVRAHPNRVSELVALTNDHDWLVGMRSVDLLEKLTHEHPEWIEPHKQVFIGRLADSDQWEIQLQIVRALPLFEWTRSQRRRAVEILRRDVEHPRTFVKAWALDSLAKFAEEDVTLRPVVRHRLRTFEQSGSKALGARAKHIRARSKLWARRES